MPEKAEAETTVGLVDESRTKLLELFSREIIGPYESHEVVFDNPQRRYIVGQLAASSDGGLLNLDDELEFDAAALAVTDETDVLADSVAKEADASDAVDGDEPAEDSASIAKARRESLSSIGISFIVDRDTLLCYSASWGEYDRKSDGTYERRPVEAEGTINFKSVTHLTTADHGRVAIKWVARELQGKLIASVFLMNLSNAGTKDGSERLYQVSLSLSLPGSKSGFLSRQDVARSHDGADLEVNDLLYRNRKEFGIGLNTAVEPIVSTDGQQCFELRSCSLPIADSHTTVSRSMSANTNALSMDWLAAQTDVLDVSRELDALFAGYTEWLGELHKHAEMIPESMQDRATIQMSAIEERTGRLARGVALLSEDAAVFKAFRFANEVMGRAQQRTKIGRKTYALGERIDNTIRAGDWRPFQLAFLLSVIPDFVEPSESYRDTVDVLFYPTGGGKTEAYLGVAAFAMAFRRLRPTLHDAGAGISTLMRYTLRLLTTQQFSRAATMICAGETVRRASDFGNSLGEEPFSIGLWVGPMTPQTFEGAALAVKQARSEHLDCSRHCALSLRMSSSGSVVLGRRDQASSVLPITECPWCFTVICIESAELDEDAKRLIIRCPNSACDFHYTDKARATAPTVDGLPLFVVDSDIYKICPTIVIATVDKFATLPFRGEAKALFGRVGRRCTICGFLTDSTVHAGHRDCTTSVEILAPADLIIQDELHTITDNLGSIYGLFETAVDFLMRSSVKPKYICATATVKAVEQQIKQLYGQRSTAIFPPVGFDAGDTYFSNDERATAKNPGRRYVGIYAPMFSRLSTFVAVLSAILACAWQVKQLQGLEKADAYLTLLGYFNTIRDLGGVKGLLGDDVPPVLLEIAKRNDWAARTLTDWQDELTGRIASAEVPERLETLQTKFTADAGCDFMAATNMISVGVDVPRLGAMVVDGQPKTTSEYIQATSRIGRRFPGVVFVVYNSMRPRDVSHYEHFYAYHDSFYKFVEAGSVTPFSDGVVDRYLRSAFVASYRLRSKKSNNDDAASYVHDASGLNNEIVAAFTERADAFGEHSRRSVKLALDDVQQKWAMSESKLNYVIYPSKYPTKMKSKVAKIPSKRQSVLRPADDQPDPLIEALFVAPRSMRNVEPEIPIKVRVDE